MTGVLIRGTLNWLCAEAWRKQNRASSTWKTKVICNFEQEGAELCQAQPAKHKVFGSNGAIFLVWIVDGWIVELLNCWIAELLICWIVEWLNCWSVKFLNCWVVELLKCWGVGLLNCWIVELLNCWIVDLLNGWMVKLLKCQILE